MEQRFYVDPVLYEGRPQDTAGRQARELAVYLHCPVAAGELLKEKMICLC